MLGVGCGVLGLLAPAAARAQCADGSPPPCRIASAAPRGAPPVSPLSIAVLPFENRSPDSTEAYLAEGLTEEINNRLTRLGRLQIRSRGLVREQWRRTPQPVAAARALNVAWFVHGNLRHVGSQLLVTVELVRAGSGEEAWASRFPRRDADVFAVQAEIAESVAVVVGGQLTPGERAAIVRRPTINNEAYRLYLFGNALIGRRTELDLRNAVEAYERALALDSNFAGAWARLSSARSIQESWGWERATGDSALTAIAIRAARRALALDSSSAEAWNALGNAETTAGNLSIGRDAFERSIRLDSTNAESFHIYAASVYSFECKAGCLGDGARAIPLFRRALALDPTLRNTWRHLAAVERDSGLLERAEAHLDTALSFGSWAPAYADRAWIRLMRGNLAGAEADFPLGEGQAQQRTIIPALIRLARGDSAPARRIMAARSDSTPGVPDLVSVALLALALGNREPALAALERAAPMAREREFVCAPRTSCSPNLQLWRLLHSPFFRPLHGEPRFQRIWNDTRPRAPWLNP